MLEHRMQLKRLLLLLFVVLCRPQEECSAQKEQYRIAGNFRKVFIFGYFEEALLFENKFPRPVVFRK